MAGPFEQVQVGGGHVVDLYLLRFSDDGRLLSPQAQRHLVDHLGDYTEVFLFSHGWNNNFNDALAHYRDFIKGFGGQGVTPAGARPALVGVIWPSISFLFPWEDGPQIAARVNTRFEEMRRLVTSGLDPEAEARLSELVDGAGRLGPAEAREAASLVRAGWLSRVDPEEGVTGPRVEEIIDAWRLLDGGAAANPADPDDFGDAGDAAGAAGSAPRAAAGLGILDPRNLLRMGTVWAMKDRAGVVGARGVATLLRLLLNEMSGPVHLIGHSFGARLLMSALVAGEVSRPVRSMLLLEPAVNRWCFAPSVINTGRVGGYHHVLSRVEQPILSTFSARDFPLHEAFHLAVRGSSLGEPNVAAFGDTGRYGALGGYGPAGLAEASVTLPAVAPYEGDYKVAANVRVVAVDGSVPIGGKAAIDGHSDVSNRVTWWALRVLTGRA
jgi:hypothetical protein